MVLSNVELIKYPLWQMPFRGIAVGLEEAVSWGKQIVAGVGQMVGGLVVGKGLPKDVSGPVGIYQVSSQVYKMGVLAVLQFVGILSINLAILNILPFPALDGGRVVFLGVEALIGKALKNRIEGFVHTVGMLLLIAFMILITIRDLGKIISG